MNLIVAKPESVLAFLLFKGWKLAETNHLYYILTHPQEAETIRFHIPKYEQAEDFNFQINNVVNHIARLYKWDNTLLLLFLSLKPEDFDILFQEWLRTGMQGKKSKSKIPTIQVSLLAAS